MSEGYMNDRDFETDYETDKKIKEVIEEEVWVLGIFKASIWV